MYIPNNDAQNKPYCRLQLVVKRQDTQIDEPTNQNLMKVLNVVKPTNKKTLLLKIGDQCNKLPNVPLPLCFFAVSLNCAKYLADI